MTAPRRQRPISRKAWERLLDQDIFGRIRTDEELVGLVLQAARHSPSPYAMLVTALLGRPGVTEASARATWVRAVDHRRRLSEALGRPVHLRVAALDLVLQEGSHPAPVVLDRGLVRSLVVEATSDALTGLPNRRHLLTVLEHELRQRHRPAVAVLDVDGFKRVNDTHGHARGDEVLRGLAGVLGATRRKGDVAARLGGDEFALLLVDAGLEAAEAVLRRAEAAFQRAFAGLGVGVSWGLVAGPEGGSAAEVLDAADRRMYAAKRARAAPGRAAAPPVIALYATGSPERFLAFHGLLAGHGIMALPAASPEVAQRLAPILAPRLLLADLLLPPRGGAALLGALGAGSGTPSAYLVAPERWRAVRRGTPEGFEVLAYPPAAAGLARVIRRISAARLPPRPALASEADAAELAGAVERLAQGEAPPDVAALAQRRPELDHLRRLLGA